MPVSRDPLVWRDARYDLLWPAPPEPPRLRYLRSIVGPADFRKEDQSNQFFRWLLGASEEGLPLLTPYAVAVSAEGVVWVADNGARMLYRIDMAREKVDYVQEVTGGRLTSPSGVAIDQVRKRIFLADAESDQILLFDFDGEFTGRWNAPDGLKRPAGLAVDKTGRLYVADVLDGTLAIFDADGRFLGRRGSKVDVGGRFNRPLSVAIGPGGEVLIVDSMNFRIEVQSGDGSLLGTIGQVGDSPGSFARPRGVAVDRDGHVYVTDAAFDNIQVFDLTGRLLMYFGSAGNTPGQFNLPAGAFADGEGRLFVTDSYNHRVQVFEAIAASR